MPHVRVKRLIEFDQVFRIECDRECNVQLMDDANYESYSAGRSFRYFGGLCRAGFPATLKPPTAGGWNVVLSPTSAGEAFAHAVSVVSPKSW
jgi:hypothetical protein